MSWNGRFDGHQNPPPSPSLPQRPVTPPDQRRRPSPIPISPSMSPNLATIISIFPGTTKQIALSALDLAGDDLEGAVQRLLEGRDLVERHAKEMEEAEKEKIAGKGEGKPEDPVTFSDSEEEVVAVVKERSADGGEMEERERETDGLPVGGAGGRWAEDASDGSGSGAVKEKELRGGDISNEKSDSEESGVPTERQQSVGRESSAGGIAESSSNGDEEEEDEDEEDNNDDSVDDEDEGELTEDGEVNIWYVLREGAKFDPGSVRGANQLFFLEGGFPDIPVRDRVKALRTTNGYLGKAVKILEKMREDNNDQIGADIQAWESGSDDEDADSVGAGPSSGGPSTNTRGKRRSRDERGDDDDEDDSPPRLRRRLDFSHAESVVSNELDLEEDTLVAVILKDGQHAAKFGKRMLWRVFTKFSLPQNFGPAKDFDEQVQNVELPQINRESFDAALLWSREKRMKFGAKTTEAEKYTIILDIVEFGEEFGLTGIGVALTGHLEKMLITARKENPQVDMTAFTPDHILKVFRWSEDKTYAKPIQDLMIRALARPFLVWEQRQDIPNDVREAIKQPLTDVQKKSFKEYGFKFPVMELHEGFANAMRKAAIETWHGREKKRENANARTRPERKTTTWILDPLTNKMDYID